ncbi:MAG: hypothetical protein A2W31_01845 [Planctomycetes bacterium RBG_16_64_10]|nr:MAG: hypothetical protein A2W31_01845 [Planctomycetes bacterium RBG_16_64_10]
MRRAAHLALRRANYERFANRFATVVGRSQDQHAPFLIRPPATPAVNDLRPRDGHLVILSVCGDFRV